jgi:hypothetical protein
MQGGAQARSPCRALKMPLRDAETEGVSAMRQAISPADAAPEDLTS